MWNPPLNSKFLNWTEVGRDKATLVSKTVDITRNCVEASVSTLLNLGPSRPWWWHHATWRSNNTSEEYVSMAQVWELLDQKKRLHNFAWTTGKKAWVWLAHRTGKSSSSSEKGLQLKDKLALLDKAKLLKIQQTYCLLHLQSRYNIAPYDMPSTVQCTRMVHRFKVLQLHFTLLLSHAFLYSFIVGSSSKKYSPSFNEPLPWYSWLSEAIEEKEYVSSPYPLTCGVHKSDWDKYVHSDR